MSKVTYLLGAGASFWKQLNFVIYLLIILATLNSCAWLDESHHEKIVGNYVVGWNDMVRNQSITKYNMTLVRGYVYAVGHNDSFIIGKHTFHSDTLTTYFIIDIKMNEKGYGYKGVYKSLNESAFDSLRRQFKITDIVFDMNYPKNP
jgi:hypothetical protein